MTTIPLRDCKKKIVDNVIIDADDLKKVSAFKWHKNKKDGYAYAKKKDGGTLVLHQLVINNPVIPKNHVIDHINRNKLDNRKENLRIVSKSLNSHNKSGKGTSKYRGVCLIKSGKFQVTINGIHLGKYKTENEAARIVDKAAIIIYGSDAVNQGVLTNEERNDILQKRDKMTVQDLLSRKPKKELPKGVFEQKRVKGNYYYVICCGKRFGQFDTIKEAQDAYEQRCAEIAKEKKDKRMNTPILRNDDGQAVIEIRDINGDVQDYAIVDEDKWHDLMKYSWACCVNMLYVSTHIDGNTVMMHHYIFGRPAEGMLIDHINHNHKDNRLSNLRECTYGDNNQNKPIVKEGKGSKYHGVIYQKDSRIRRWGAQISKDGIRYKLGHYFTEEEAAKAYDDKAKELYDNPYLNNITEDDIPQYCIMPGKDRKAKTTPIGVRKVGNMFYAQYKTQRLGSFKTVEEAEKAYLSGKEKAIKNNIS